jgi:hypothetical protein
MGKKSKSAHQDARKDSGDKHRSVVRELGGIGLAGALDGIENVILEISKTSEYSFEEKQGALGRLLKTVFQAAKYLQPPVVNRPLWKNRAPSSSQSPFDFLAETYSEEIAAGTLAKSDVRERYFSLYKALANPHWKAKAPTNNSFSMLPSKRKSYDTTSFIPDGVTRNDVISLLPMEFQEMLRHLHAAEMRRYRASK